MVLGGGGGGATVIAMIQKRAASVLMACTCSTAQAGNACLYQT